MIKHNKGHKVQACYLRQETKQQARATPNHKHLFFELA